MSQDQKKRTWMMSCRKQRKKSVFSTDWYDTSGIIYLYLITYGQKSQNSFIMSFFVHKQKHMGQHWKMDLNL